MEYKLYEFDELDRRAQMQVINNAKDIDEYITDGIIEFEAELAGNIFDEFGDIHEDVSHVSLPPIFAEQII